MAASVSASVTAAVTVTETLDATYTPSATSGNREVTHTAFNCSTILNSTSTPTATNVAANTKALSGGAATIDLTSVAGTNNATVSGNALKVQAALFTNPATNTGAITVTVGASNGYTLAGAAWKAIIPVGGSVLYYLASGGATIGSGAKTIDLSGTGTESLQYVFVFGA